jgi:gliding motility-associated-like protein
MKKVSFFNLLLLFIIAFPFSSFAEGSKIIFEENKNQWPNQVRFQANIKGGSIFFEKNTFTYAYVQDNVFSGHGHALSNTSIIKHHAFKVDFLNSNPNVEIFGDNLLEGVRNYYRGSDPKNWASDVKLYSKVKYNSLYPSIDMDVYSVEGNLKYDLIVNPGGNTKNIKLNYTGPDEMHLEYGHLYIKTSVGLIIEQKPYAYQIIEGLKTQVVCSYSLKNNILNFDLGEYNTLFPLVIDPTIIGATYTGSTTDNRGYTATYDAAANMYTGGKANAIGYPLTLGAYQSGSQGAWDIVLSKFNPTATTLLFSTYYGGSGDEQPHSIIVNSKNELYVVGRTNSTNFPTLNTYGASYQAINRGGYDIIVGKFNSTGGLLASTYIGGTGDDGVNISIGTAYSSLKTSWGDDGRSEIILDSSSNVYVAACTRSSSDFPTQLNSYAKNIAGSQDGIVFKMNSSLTTLNFSTYLGGGNNDACYGLKLDNSGKIYVTGGTEGSGFPTTSGVIKPTFGGVCDGFISVFDPSLSNAAQLVRSTYLGTTAYDQSYLIEIDVSGDLYVYGQTAGSYPITPVGVYSYPNSAPPSGMFIHKLKGNLASTIFSTVIGNDVTSPFGIPLSPTAFLVDSCQTIYISGWGRCPGNDIQWSNAPSLGTSTGLPTTANAYEKTTDGCDFYFAVLAPDAKKLEYATFFGEDKPDMPDHVDGGTSRFDKRGVIYESMCSSCLGTSGIATTPGAYSSKNGSTADCNNFLLKMDIAPRPHAAASIPAGSPSSGCAPFVVKFSNINGTDTSKASKWVWDFGDGGFAYVPAPTYTFSFPGTYVVTIYAIDTIGICGFNDTAYVTVKVGAIPTIKIMPTNVLCNPGLGIATVSVTPNGTMPPLAYLWSTTPKQSTSIASGLVPSKVYSVTVSDALGCSSTKTVIITQPSAPLTLTTTTTPSTCGFSNGSATAFPQGGINPYTYNWNPGGKTTKSITAVAQGDYTLTVTDANKCSIPLIIDVPVSNGPTITATAVNHVSCKGGSNGSAIITQSDGNSPFTYAWLPSSGSSTTTSNLIAGTYVVVITDKDGCKGKDTVVINEPLKAVSYTLASTDAKCFRDKNGIASVNNISGGTPGYTYSWSTIPVQTSSSATGLGKGTYTVTITDNKGCNVKPPVKINEPDSLTIKTANSGSSCGTHAKGVITTTLSGGTQQYQYKWLPAGQTTKDLVNILAGTYTLNVVDANGCTKTHIAVFPPEVQPVADFIYAYTIQCDKVVVHFTSSNKSLNAKTWHWNFAGLGTSNLENPTFDFPLDNASYNITLSVTNPPCDSTLTKVLQINKITEYFKIAETNIFTPNNDKYNDCFQPYFEAIGVDTLDLKKCISLEVYDRWGVKMFESVGADNCWDGSNPSEKKPAVEGTYYYVATLGNIKARGYVYLARQPSK